MAINRNLIRRYREALQEEVHFDDVIDLLISKKVIDFHLYNTTYTLQTSNKRISHLLNVVGKDDRAAGIFIDILYKYGEEKRYRKIAEAMVSERETIRDVIVHGGFPDLPPNYVDRTSQEKVIRREIKNLRAENGEVLVVHGMTGFGKSCLVNQILQDTEFVELSNHAMFWLSSSQHDHEESIAQAMASLYTDAVSLSDLVPIPTCPENYQGLKHNLRTLFLRPKLKNALIVLDDVKSRKVVEAFINIACRMIITTQDKDVVPHSNKIKYTQVIQGFSEKETLELFKKSLNTSVLPHEANEIHNLCEGFPILVNMIGCFLEESREEALSSNKQIWNSIKEEVSRNGLPLLNNYKDDIVFIIKRNEEKLNPNYRTYFRDLALFPKHVYIRPEILMELWGKNLYTVRQIMLALANKSLVVSFYHNDLQSYVYSIHTLVYFYLEENKDENRMTELHRKLIDTYYTRCNDYNFNGAANYILAYYGYHLKNAKLDDRFSIFFDLKFLEKKLKSVGSVDVLRDLDVYHDYITRHDPVLEKKLDDYKQFLNKYSLHLQRFPETNIVQYALYNKKFSSVFQTGLEVARNNPDALYFEVQLYCGENQYYPSIKLDQEVTAVCYTENDDAIIAGTSRGDIGILYWKATRFHKQTDAHCDRVFHLQMSPDKKWFLSISDDGKAILWNYINLDLDSPINKQESWQNPHTGTELRMKFEMEQNDDAITTAAFPTNFNDRNMHLITGSKRGSLILWDIKTQTALMRTPVTGVPIRGVIFANDDNEVIVSCDKNINIYKIGLSELIYSRQCSDNSKIISLRIMPKSNKIIAVHNNYFNIWTDSRNKKTVFFNEDYQTENDDVKVAEVTSDEKYLTIGTNNFIYVFVLQTNVLHKIRNDFLLSVLSLRIIQDEILFVGADNVKIEKRCLQLNTEDRPVVKEISDFSCYWRNQIPLYPIFNEYQMHFFKGNVPLTQIDINDGITCSTFSLCGNYLLFGCKSGKLVQYNYKTKTLSIILECDEEIDMIRCFDEEYDLNNSFTSSDDDFGLMVIGTKHKIITIGNRSNEYYFNNGFRDFFYSNVGIIVMDYNGNLCILDNEHRLIYKGDENWKVTTADHRNNHNYNLFAITYVKDKEYFLRIIKFDNGFTQLKDDFEIELKWKPLVSKISFNCKLLAVGSNDGSILLLNLDNKELSYLWFHQRPVQSLIFAPTNEPILVSLSDQVAWWNLKSFQVSSSQNSTPDTIMHNFDAFTLGFSSWSRKKVSDTTPYLLASVNLHGKLLRFISASQKFTSFVIVDEEGNIYKLDVI